ncbi:hypothetical protein [Faecousia sp.]|jgi:hypothetical protein|uniref:hypothetical protein n=1 Tax=Faecousia sp. TaxID=2952921 RepID=UPI00349EF75F
MNFFVKILQIDYRIRLCRFFFLWTDIFALKHQALEMAMFEINKNLGNSAGAAVAAPFFPFWYQIRLSGNTVTIPV